ncbi:hypothetical protein LQZ18_18015 [Lachnospiraceae bacterium ZAX-1]
MKIAFWSEKPDIGTTFNMAAIACIASMKYSFRSALISAGYNDDDLELSFNSGREIAVAELSHYCKSGSLDNILEAGGETTPKKVLGNMKSIIKNKLDCLPAGKQFSAFYPEYLEPQMEQITQIAEQYYDIVFIDCGSKRDAFARKMLQKADVVVVNFEQELESLYQFYQNQYNISGKKFFLICNCFMEDIHNKSNLHRIFRMGEDKIGAIPYNLWLAKAFLAGKTEKYFQRHMKGDLKEQPSVMLQEMMDTTFQILKTCQLI